MSQALSRLQNFLNELHHIIVIWYDSLILNRILLTPIENDSCQLADLKEVLTAYTFFTPRRVNVLNRTVEEIVTSSVYVGPSPTKSRPLPVDLCPIRNCGSITSEWNPFVPLAPRDQYPHPDCISKVEKTSALFLLSSLLFRII